MIDDEFLASSGCPTNNGFVQPEVFANLRCRQTRIPNRPVGQNPAGTYPIGLFSGDNHLVFLKEDGNVRNQRPAVAGRGGLLQNRTEPFQKVVSIGIVFKSREYRGTSIGLLFALAQ